MLPTIPIGPLRIQTYGLFLLLAYFAGLWLAARLARHRGIDGDHVYNAGFYALLAGLVAARLGHAVAYFEAYRADPRQILSLSPGALLPLPGLIGAAAVVAIYVWRHRLPALPLADAAAPGVLLAIVVADMGAFLAGRMLGAPSDLPWALELFGVRRHPAALYEALASLALLAVLLWLDRSRRLKPGQLLLLTLFGYATVCLFLEPLRAGSSTIGDGWRVPQIVALAVIAISGWLLGRMAGPHRRHPPSSAPAHRPDAG